MAKVRFPIDPTQLDRSAAAAFDAHTAGRLSYAGWKATAAQIERLRGVEAFRRQHDAALFNANHPEHARRAAELQSMYETAYPDEPQGVP
jgi:hypothetical protein